MLQPPLEKISQASGSIEFPVQLSSAKHPVAGKVILYMELWDNSILTATEDVTQV